MLDLIQTHHLVPLLALAPLLVLVAWSDLRNLRIPNAYCLSTVAVFALAMLLGFAPDYPLRIVISASVFVLGFGAYCLGLFGGGDVKFLSALMLFIPVETLQIYAFVFSGAMLIGIVGVMLMKRVPASATRNWRSMAPGRQVPMGVPMALSGLLHPIVLLWWMAAT